MAGVFVTATDTGVGKTVVGAAIVAAARRAGVAARPLKPVLTGTEEQGVEHDHELLGRVGSIDPELVSPYRFRYPASPHLASALERRPLDGAELIARCRELADRCRRQGEPLVVEGVGGLLVPLDAATTVADLAGALGLPLVVVARPGLGTINHTLLTLEAARSRSLAVAAVVLNPFPAEPDRIEASNRETLAQAAGVPVHALPPLEELGAAALARAGELLPWRSWL